MKNIFNWFLKKSKGFVIPEYKYIPPQPPKEKTILSKEDFYLWEYKDYWKIEAKDPFIRERCSDKAYLRYITKEKAIEAVDSIIYEYNNYPKRHEI